MIGKMDMILTLVGIFYGVVLIWAAFISNKITEAFRIDTLLFPRNASQNTRMLNLFFGLLVFGYCGYSLVKSLF